MPKKGEPSERRWHILKSVKGESVPERILVLQVEPLVRHLDGKVHEHTFLLAAGCDYHLVDGTVTNQEERFFSRPEEVMQWLGERKVRDRVCWVYSFGMVYCLTLLGWWRAAARSGEIIRSATLTDPPTIIQTCKGRYVSKYVDVRNYVRNWEWTGLPGCSITSHPDTAFSDSASGPRDKCMAKVRIVGDFVCRAIKLVRSNRWCSWQPTAASLAFSAYRHSFLCSPVAIHAHPEATKLERSALYGGRNQIWKTGLISSPVWIFDVNSLYPYVMSEYPMPVRLTSYQEGASLSELYSALHGHECVAEVSIRECALDLPLRAPLGLCFSGGSRRLALAGAELRAAAASGAIDRVHNLARYAPGAPFTGFVKTLYRHKLAAAKSGKIPEAHFVKLLLNSLYGKFSQLKRGWYDTQSKAAPGCWRTWIGYDGETASWRPHRNLGGVNQVFRQGGESRHSFPAISAAITSAGRIELARHIRAIEPALPLYADTDSLHVQRNGRNGLAASGLCHPTKIGRLREVIRADDAFYWGLKHYRVGDRFCCCFLSASAEQVGEGRYLDSAKIGFEHVLAHGLPSEVRFKDRLVEVGDANRSERRPLVSY